MEMLEIAGVIFLGLCFGSFATLLGYRLPLGLPVTLDRSRCPACKIPLGIKDLFPVGSWLAFGGKCRHCEGKIPVRYPLTELATVLLFLLVYARFGLSAQAIFLMLLAVCLVVMFLADFAHYIIPDQVQLAMGALGMIYKLCLVDAYPADVLAGALTGLAIGIGLQYGFRILFRKDGLGTGDVKFLLVAGLWLGTRELVPLLFFSGLLGIVTAVFWRGAGKGPVFPFGPALGASMFLQLVFPEISQSFWHLGEWTGRTVYGGITPGQ